MPLAISVGFGATLHLWRKKKKIPQDRLFNNVTVCWVPGHEEIPGNECPDQPWLSVNYDRPSTVLWYSKV
ncbi:hypothetical protein J6590_007437 [Homalodisca vitripennis]|nr:hypothetical protein J6590_007437 [Homalodisca vitripennis]